MDDFNNIANVKVKQGIGGWLLFFVITIFIYMFSAFLSIFDSINIYVTYFVNLDFIIKYHYYSHCLWLCYFL